MVVNDNLKKAKPLSPETNNLMLPPEDMKITLLLNFGVNTDRERK